MSRSAAGCLGALLVALALSAEGCRSAAPAPSGPGGSVNPGQGRTGPEIQLKSNKLSKWYIDGAFVGQGRWLKARVGDPRQPHHVVAKAEGYQAKEDMLNPPYSSRNPYAFTFMLGDRERAAPAPAQPAPVAARPQPVRRQDPVLETPRDSAPVPAGQEFGAFHALLIGNNEYQALPKLKTAVNDVRVLAYLLENDYGYRVQTLENATRDDIVLALSTLRRTLRKEDNLLVYYAGHGWLDQGSGEGYWLPVDATKDNEVKWVSNATITTAVKAIAAHHVMVVADSCYSGSLTRGLTIKVRAPDYYQQIRAKRTRVVMTSGGLEPVEDGGGGNNSIFSQHLVRALRENKGIMDGSTLFSQIQRPVVLNSNQEPHYGDIRLTGHEGGDFLFVKTKK